MQQIGRCAGHEAPQMFGVHLQGAVPTLRTVAIVRVLLHVSHVYRCCHRHDSRCILTCAPFVNRICTGT
jgi:hypothetical protein